MLSQEEKQQEHLIWMVSHYATLLANVIQIITLTERTINSCIGNLLCKDESERASIIKLLIDPLTFNNKSRLLKRILKDRRPELYDKYIKTIETLDKLYVFRSDLAHAYIETTDTQITKFDKTRIPYSKPASPQIMYIDTKEADEKFNQLRNVNGEIHNLYKEIKTAGPDNQLSF